MITLKTALNEFTQRLMRKGYSSETIFNYVKITKVIFAKCGKTQNRTEITAEEIEDCIFETKTRARTTKNVNAVRIRAFIKFCLMKKYLDINYQMITVIKGQSKEAKYLNEKEVEKVLDRLEAEEIRFRSCILLMLTTGIRISEACSITKRQFKSAIEMEGLYQIPIEGKGGKTRPIFIYPGIYKMLTRCFKSHNSIPLLDHTKIGLDKKIRNFSKKIGIKFTAHTLRHTYLTRLAQNGVELYKIQKIAGHNCIITTSRYLHSCNKELAQAVWNANFSF